MDNLEFEFIDRAISMIKEGYDTDAVSVICEESNLNINEARVFRDLLTLMLT